MSDDAGKPEWWRRAQALEAQDKLEEAEEVVKNAIPHLYFAHATADLYRERMIRKMEEGDQAGALEAFRQAKSFIYFMASLATSGGEGAALSGERDQFMRELVGIYGSDPE
jgi:hypothetical protein